ncbi:unnamed protein product, partial [Closterium sp. Naga37s-1]
MQYCAETFYSLFFVSRPGEVRPVKMFERTANLNGSQIINYQSDPSGKWLALIGIAPGAPEVSAKFGLVYVVTKLGLLFVYDLESATAIYRNRISPDPIFLAADAPSVGGVYAVNLRGKVLLATVNEQAIVPFVSGQLNSPELAISLARRMNLPGAENLVSRSSGRKDVVVAKKSAGSQSPAAAGRSGEKGRRFSLKENLGSWFRSQPSSSNSVDRTATAITHQSLASGGKSANFSRSVDAGAEGCG